MTFGFGLFLFAFAVVLFPHISILRKFEKERAYPFGRESFQTFQILDIVCIAICIILLGLSITRVSNYSDRFSLLAIFLVLITIPTAVYSSSTGIYPGRTTRGGYCYFQKYKDPAKQFLMSSKYPELKTLGQVQLIFLIAIAGIAASHVFL